MRPSTPRRRLERLERKMLMHLDGGSRAEFLLHRLHRQGPLTQGSFDWLRVLLPLDPTERCNYISTIRAAALADGIETPWVEEDELPEGAKRLVVNWHIVDRRCEVRDGAPSTTLVSPIAEEAWDDYQEWQQHPPYGDEPRPLLTRETYVHYFLQQRPLYLKSALRQPA